MMSDHLLADIGLKRDPEVSLRGQREMLWRRYKRQGIVS